MLDLIKLSEIEEKLATKGFVIVNKQRAEYKNGLIYVEGDTGSYENPMTFDTYIHLYLTGIPNKSQEDIDFMEER